MFFGASSYDFLLVMLYCAKYFSIDVHVGNEDEVQQPNNVYICDTCDN